MSCWIGDDDVKVNDTDVKNGKGSIVEISLWVSVGDDDDEGDWYFWKRDWWW